MLFAGAFEYDLRRGGWRRREGSAGKEREGGGEGAYRFQLDWA